MAGLGLRPNGWLEITGPIEEPVSLADAKAHLRVFDNREDAIISDAIVSARKQCENYTSRRFIDTTLDFYFDDFSDRLVLPLGPLDSVSSVQYVTSDGVQGTVDPSIYMDAPWESPPMVLLHYTKEWPSVILRPKGGVIVRAVIGYGPDASYVPRNIKSAILLLVGDRYENRENVVVGQGFTVSALKAAEALVDQERLEIA